MAIAIVLGHQRPWQDSTMWNLSDITSPERNANKSLFLIFSFFLRPWIWPRAKQWTSLLLNPCRGWWELGCCTSWEWCSLTRGRLPKSRSLSVTKKNKRSGPHLRAGGGSQFQNDPGFGGVGVGQFSPLNTLSWGWGGVLSPPLSPQQLGGKMFAGDP